MRFINKSRPSISIIEHDWYNHFRTVGTVDFSSSTLWYDSPWFSWSPHHRPFLSMIWIWNRSFNPTLFLLLPWSVLSIISFVNDMQVPSLTPRFQWYQFQLTVTVQVPDGIGSQMIYFPWRYQYDGYSRTRTGAGIQHLESFLDINRTGKSRPIQSIWIESLTQHRQNSRAKIAVLVNRPGRRAIKSYQNGL